MGERAGVPLAEFRREFGSTFDIVAAFSKDLDRKVLAAIADDDADATPRERLFDVMMQRFEILVPHRRAVENLRASGLRFPPLGMALGRLSLRSMQWMLAGAGIETTGLRGMARAQGLAVLFARVSETWLDDDDPDLSRTMAALDRELARAWDWSTRHRRGLPADPQPRCRRDRRERTWTRACPLRRRDRPRRGDLTGTGRHPVIPGKRRQPRDPGLWPRSSSRARAEGPRTGTVLRKGDLFFDDDPGSRVARPG